jgi:hypothetical protein
MPGATSAPASSSSSASSSPLTDDELQRVYRWVDHIPMSRPKRHIARDFSDGVLMSELIAHFFPQLVELHNYSKSNASTQKQYNWATLNQKVFKKLGFQLSSDEIDAIAVCEKSAIERCLLTVQARLSAYQQKLLLKKDSSSSSSSSTASSRSATPAAAAAAAAAAITTTVGEVSSRVHPVPVKAVAVAVAVVAVLQQRRRKRWAI